MEVRYEVEKAAEGLLYNNHNQAHAIASLCPLLHSLCSHRRNAVQNVAVLLEDCAEFHRHCECDSDIRYVREDGLQVRLPFFCRALATACAKSRLASVEHQLGFNFRCVDFCAEGNGPTLDDFPEGFADMRWGAFVVPVLSGVVFCGSGSSPAPTWRARLFSLKPWHNTPRSWSWRKSMAAT